MTDFAQPLLIRGGTVFTAAADDPADAVPAHASVAVTGGRILLVGDENACRRALPASTEVIDATGGTVLPGLFDCHAHLLDLGDTHTAVDLRGTTSFRQAVDLTARAAAEAGPGEWVVGRGWDHARGGLRDYPDGADLDAAAPRNPVLLNRFDGHAAIANAAALAAAGITAHTPDPPDGVILRRPDGTPTGVLLEGAARPARAAVPPPSPAGRRRRITAGARDCLALGLTSILDAIDDIAWIDDYQALIDAGTPLPRIHGMLSAPGDPQELAARLFDDVGDLALTLRRLRLILDGGLGARGAWLSDPYSDEPGSTGFRMLTDRHLQDAATAALGRGFSLCVHAIGDRAVTTLLDSYERTLALHPRADHRLMIEHATVVADRDVARIAALRVIPSVQPVHAVDDAPWLTARLGGRTPLAYRFADLRRAGARLACGSDFPVASPNPLRGIAAAVDGPARQRLTLAEALYGYTRWAAHAAFAEQQLGSLEPGKRADITILDGDLFTATVGEMAGIPVRHTVRGGRIVYSR